MTTRHMRLTGHARLFKLTEDAHGELVTYLNRARTALGVESEADETLRDLEASIGDQLEVLYPAPDTIVGEEHLRTILERSGPIAADSLGSADPAPPRGPFWARISEGKWLGGLCLGIAARGGFAVEWVRGVAVVVAFLVAGILAPLGEGIPMLLFIAATGIGYLALMLGLPSVRSLGEYRRLSKTPLSR